MAKNPYVIKIELPSETQQSAMAETQAGSVGGGSSGDNISAEIAVKAAQRLVSFAAVKSTADNLISYRISQVSLETGASEYEQRASAIHSIVSQTVGAGAALVIGGVTGGPAGLAMAAIGIAANGISKAINIFQKAETLRTQQGLENVSIEMQTIRAGTNGRRGANQ